MSRDNMWVRQNSKCYLGLVNGQHFRIDIVDTGTGFWTAETVYLYHLMDDGSEQLVGTEDYEHMIAGQEDAAISRAKERAQSYWAEGLLPNRRVIAY